MNAYSLLGDSVPQGDGAPTDLETQLGATWEDHTLVQTQQTLEAVSKTGYSGRARLMEPVAATPPRDTQLDCENTAASGPLDRTGAIVPDFWYSYIEPPVPSGGAESNADGTTSGPDATSATGSSAGSSTAHANVPRAGLPAALAQAAAGLPSVSIKGGLAAQISSLGTATSVSGLFGSVSLWPGHNDLAATLPASLGSMARPDLQLQAALGQLPGISLGTTTGAADPTALIVTRSASEWVTPQTTRPRPADPTGFADAGTGLGAANWTFVASYQSEGNHVVQLAQPDPDGAGPAEAPLTELSYDAQGNLVQVMLPDGSTRHWTYDATSGQLGHQTRRTDRNGRVTVYAYDALQRLTTETWYDNATDADAQENESNVIHYGYDAVGRLVAESDDYSSYTYTFDVLDRVTTETVDNAGIPEVVFTTGYDGPENLRTSFSATIGGVADFLRTYQYDALGQMTHIGQAAQPDGNPVAALGIDLRYDASGRLSGLDRYLGTDLVATSTYQYDPRGYLTSLLHAQGTTTLAAYTWAYDAAGRLTEASSPDGGVCYACDSTDQLTGADYSAGAGLPTAPPDETYAYDANGNRIAVGADSSTAVCITGPNYETLFDGTYRYEYDPEGNRIARYIWTDIDDDGQIDSGERSQITEYAWDNRNRLVSVTDYDTDGGLATPVVQYTYDTHNRWISRTLDPDGAGQQVAELTQFVYDANQIILQFEDPDGSGSQPSTLNSRLLWGPAVDQILADEQLPVPPAGASDIQVLWALADHLGTPRDIGEFDDATGITAIVNHRVFDAFGEMPSQTNSELNFLFSFTGRPFDEATGLRNHLNRWAQNGRWLSEDPFGLPRRRCERLPLRGESADWQHGPYRP